MKARKSSVSSSKARPFKRKPIPTPKILDRLEVGGRLAIMIYYGHDGGDMEKDAVLEYVIGLDQRDFTAMLYQPLNQINTPPFLVMLEKLQ